MKNASAALKAFLPSARQFFQADLFSISPGPFQNFLKWSESFDNAAWTKNQMSAITPNTIINPSGVLNAEALIPSGGATDAFANQVTSASSPAGMVCTFSVWLKVPAGTKAINISIGDQGGGSTSLSITITTAWQRFSVTRTMTGGAQIAAQIGGATTWTSGEIDAWGAQVEARPVPGPYARTMTVPAGDPHQALQSPLFFTSADADISWQNTAYSSKSPFVSRSELKWSLGLTVDTLDVQIDAKPTDLYSGLGFLQQLQLGVFDGARFQLDRLFGSSFGNWVDSVTLFTGNIADIKNLGRTRCELQVRSRLELLNNSLPRNLFQPSCRWSLFDAGCTLSKASFASTGTLAGGSTAAILLSSSLAQATGFFDLGTLVFTSGPNAGTSITVRKFTSGSPASIAAVVPLQNVPQTGDAFVIYPGCDKLQSTCLNKFNNLINHGGFEYIPTPETAI